MRCRVVIVHPSDDVDTPTVLKVTVWAFEATKIVLYTKTEETDAEITVSATTSLIWMVRV